MYIENPKTKGSGIICAIPQTGECLLDCKDCFFQNGRSYLEPLSENLPNLPSDEQATGRVVRMNDGNDSSFEFDIVVAAAGKYKDAFYNTSQVALLDKFPGPVVLTVNPASRTDGTPKLLDVAPPNLMFVRFRTNAWNLDNLRYTAQHYNALGVTVIVTFLAYYTEPVPQDYSFFYSKRKRTTNIYKVIRPRSRSRIMLEYSSNDLVRSCGSNPTSFACKHCGNCLREYYATKERLRAIQEVKNEE